MKRQQAYIKSLSFSGMRILFGSFYSSLISKKGFILSTTMQKAIVIYLFIHLVLSSRLSYAQTCTGNLGENIFTGGDFGSGVDNLLLPDPKIAPGYQYSRNLPPFDGLYVITNSTNWPGLFPTWLVIKDNSQDPNGYMMVVNANFSPGIFYEQTIGGLCENTLYEFSADIINLVRRTTTNHILPNVSFLIDGVVKYNTGAIPQSEQWNKVGFTFTTVAGQDSLTLSLQNNAPGGNGNDLALDNISFRACGPKAFILSETIANICEDGQPIDITATIVNSPYSNPSIQWQRSADGVLNWTNVVGNTSSRHSDLVAGFYYYRYLIASSPQNLTNPKCRIISNVKVIRVQPKTFTITDTICDGLSYQVGLKRYTRSGIYIDSLKSSIGCDSIVTLRLTVLPDRGIEVDKIITHPSCIGIEDGNLKITGIRQGHGPYVIKLDTTSLPLIDSTFRRLANGTYHLEIIDDIGCRLRESIQITTPDPFIIELGENRDLNLGDPMILMVKSLTMIAASRYVLDKSSVCDLNCEGQIWVPFHSGQLIVSATSPSGCSTSDSIQITVKEVVKAFIPNVFSPNGDGLNDYFMIQADGSNVKSITRLQIFDRYGGLIFNGQDLLPNDLTQGWDGRIHGQPAIPGSYVYHASLELINGRRILRSGDILLLR